MKEVRCFALGPEGTNIAQACRLWLRRNGIEDKSTVLLPASGRSDPLFLLFLAGSESESPLRDAVGELRRSSELLKMLGSYPAYERGVARSDFASAKAPLAVVG